MDELAYRCPVCSSAMVSNKLLYDDRYGFPGEFGLYYCTNCRHRTLGVQMTAGQLTDLYTNYYPRSEMDVVSWTPQKENSSLCGWWHGFGSSAFRWVPPNVKVLDIGCGFGQSLGYHRARGCDAHGVELDGNIRSVAERYRLNIRVGLFNADNYDPDSFDYVTLDQVIEHVSDPITFMAGVNRVLKPGGITVISTPNAQGWGAWLFRKRWIHWHAPYHQQFFSVKSIQIAAIKSGFEFVDAKTITNSEWLRYQWLHLLTYPMPGKPSAYWSTRVHTGKIRRVIMKGVNTMHWLKLNHLITRLFDLIGVGDNRVYFLRKP